MKNLVLSLMFVSLSNLAVAGGPQVKFFTKRHGALESSPAKDAVVTEFKNGTDLGICYKLFFRELQFGLSGAAKCHLHMMKEPITLEITLNEDDVNATVRVPEYKSEILIEDPYKNDKADKYSCGNLVQQILKEIKSSAILPFAKNYHAAVLKDILESGENGSFFEERTCQ